VHNKELWFEMWKFDFILKYCPAMFFPKGTSREETSTAMRTVLELFHRLASIYMEAQVTAENADTTSVYSDSNARTWFNFLNHQTLVTGKSVHANDLVHIKSLGIRLVFFDVAMVALDLRHRAEAVAIRRAILSTPSTPLSDFEAYINNDNLVAFPPAFLGPICINSANGNKQKSKGKRDPR
jgi:hypothetical protein